MTSQQGEGWIPAECNGSLVFGEEAASSAGRAWLERPQAWGAGSGEGASHLVSLHLRSLLAKWKLQGFLRRVLLNVSNPCNPVMY